MVQLTRPVPPKPSMVPWPYKLPRNKLERQEDMAKWEIHKRAGNLVDAAWWRWMPGVTISVAWPNGPIIKEYMDQYRTDEQLLSADPNDHYRPELTSLVGKQGVHWNWGLRDNNVAENRLTIKICKSKSQYASYFALKWA